MKFMSMLWRLSNNSYLHGRAVKFGSKFTNWSRVPRILFETDLEAIDAVMPARDPIVDCTESFPVKRLRVSENEYLLKEYKRDSAMR